MFTEELRDLLTFAKKGRCVPSHVPRTDKQRIEIRRFTYSLFITAVLMRYTSCKKSVRVDLLSYTMRCPYKRAPARLLSGSEGDIHRFDLQRMDTTRKSSE